MNDAVVRALKSGAKLLADGHTIFSPEKYVKDGWPVEFVASLVTKHRSDTSDPKRTITKGGEIQKEVEGVYNLSFLRAVAREVESDRSWANQAFGRGTEAGRLVEAIAKRRAELGGS